MAMRNIVEIDEEKCDGCGLCIIECAEGALEIRDGKAKIIKEMYCDGLGACIGECPQEALTIIKKEADPFDEELRQLLINVCKNLGLKHHKKGTVITIEGPRFSTRAESNFFRQWADVINMSIAPEAILANEAGIKYAAIAMSTDYDCWKIDEDPVTWEEILKVFNENAEKVKKVLVEVIPKIK